MKKIQMIQILAIIALMWVACDNCEKKEVAALLMPSGNEDSLVATSVTWHEIPSGISCLDSRFFEISNTWPKAEVVADLRAMSGHSIYNGFKAGALIIRSEAAFNGIRDLGCLEGLDPFLNIDWITQTLIVTHVQSDAGCLESTDIAMQQNERAQARLTVTVTYSPDGGCTFDFPRSFVVDTASVAARVSIVAGCGE
ncbi:MAG: hypothetical protein JXR76_09040 [Deltaproteobacteria bacterium]|nr:hypothetical protein [Deltaproteobacteria bacterium]